MLDTTKIIFVISTLTGGGWGEYLRGLETCLVRITSARLNRNTPPARLLAKICRNICLKYFSIEIIMLLRNITKPPLIRVSPQIRGGSNFSSIEQTFRRTRIHTSREFPIPHKQATRRSKRKKKI